MARRMVFQVTGPRTDVRDEGPLVGEGLSSFLRALLGVPAGSVRLGVECFAAGVGGDLVVDGGARDDGRLDVTLRPPSKVSFTAT